MSAAARRWPALIAASLGLHLLALGTLPGVFSRDTTTPLYVDLTTPAEPVGPPEMPASAKGGLGPLRETRGRPSAPPRPAPAPPGAVTEPSPITAATGSPPPPSDRPALPPPPTASPAPPDPTASPSVSATRPEAPPAAAAPPSTATTRESRPGAISGASGSRQGGERPSTDGAGVDPAGAPAGPAGALLALARPGDDRGGLPAEYAPYLTRFRQRVEEALVYPLAARRRGQGGRVELEVLLEPTGRVGRVEIAVSSANPALDEAAVAAVRAIEPAPFPSDLPRRPLLVRLPLVFQLR